MSDPDIVYLVEDHTDPEPASHTKYFAKVYLSRSKAQASAEHWAQRGGHGEVRGEDHAPASYAYAADDADGSRLRELYRWSP
ncbi:hypothetical protein [Pseudonocardia kunmingensis]|uniref:Uncharacterized protein n=1 Tax=Pseudonocardia kunmingensis TaxID=630975 RepID=A0A543CWY1_9PSEU|nr:hypothetical protein [Pseudonocardia kunmingensis]TQM01615.1 hypothetical protein FB558_8508 [Pseudonocardia kunmingensis]